MGLNPETLQNLKVTELKVELKQRGLPTAGLKAVLVSRLREFLLNEEAEPEPEPEPSPQAETELETEPTPEATPGEEAEAEVEVAPKSKSESEPEPEPVASKEKTPEAEVLAAEPTLQSEESSPADEDNVADAPEVEVEVQPEQESTPEVIEAQPETILEERPEIATRDELVHEPELSAPEPQKEQPPIADDSAPAEPIGQLEKVAEQELDKESEQVATPQGDIVSMMEQEIEKPTDVTPMEIDEPALESEAVQDKQAGSIDQDDLPEASTNEDSDPIAKAALPEELKDAVRQEQTALTDSMQATETTDPTAQEVLESAVPMAADPEAVVTNPDAMDTSEAIDTLKRKRRSPSPPPTSTENTEPPERIPSAKKPRRSVSPDSQSRRPVAPPARDARFKGLFNDASTAVSEPQGPPGEPQSDDDDTPVTPSLHPATRALYIRNFLRPLNEASLRAHILSLATRGSSAPASIDTFFLDTIRSHALIVFSNTAAATRVRVGIHAKTFPPEKTRKPLWADFVPEDAVAGWIERERASTGRGGNARWEVAYDTSDGEVRTELVEAGTTIPTGPRRQSEAAVPTAPAPVARGPDGKKRVVMNLDELFMSTREKPKLYFLPVDESIAQARLAKQGRDSTGRF
ncbi:hypothetical protein EDC01DRAFT_677517 [Geopyxis carbonaria]|nr:hypothetical protein EDC01DRAFT_677517 [Geopyxis carbonaria]